MKKEQKCVEIGEFFRVVNNIKDGYSGHYWPLYACYKRPSWNKEHIYKQYEDMLYANCDNVIEYGIRSFNSMIITLEAIIEKDGQKYYLKITPSYNYAQPIED